MRRRRSGRTPGSGTRTGATTANARCSLRASSSSRSRSSSRRWRPHPQARLQRGDGHGGGATVTFATQTPPALPVDGRASRPIGFLQDFLAAHDGRCLLVAETPGRREILLETLGAHGLNPELIESWGAFVEGGAGLAMTVAALEDGACIDAPPAAVITESQLFGARAAQRRRRRGSGRDPEGLVRDLNELRIGAPVVHEAHGVGRYAGLEVLTVGGVHGEFLRIDYADGDKLYVPVGSLQLVSRYTGVDPEAAPLHKLGSRQWQRARRRAAERVADVAAELLEVQARRASRPGVAFDVEPEYLHGFEAAFPFEETPDQASTIEQVAADMRKAAPMDRLVCGDVGFGKTEVAMRAAFIAVQSGKQVAVLVPTTLLAQQITRRSATGSRTGRYGSSSSRAFAPVMPRTRSCAVSPAAPSTSSSAPTSCSTAGSGSSAWGWWSSTRSIASACARRNGSRRCGPRSTSSP